MVKINRKVEYALMALMHLSQKSSLTSVKEVCESTGSPFDATSRVMQQMSQAHILHSEQGAQGGYKIKAELSNLSFYKLSEVVLGSLELAKCIKHPESCDLLDRCNIYNPILSLNKRVMDFYKSISIEELLEKNSVEKFSSAPNKYQPTKSEGA